MSIYLPTISIIVPVYNVEYYLERCLNSILCQSYTQLEIICIDDGSTDSSGEILDDFAKKDTRIRAIHQKNRGISETRNLGLLMASGEYIGFVDSDDYIHPDMYHILIDAITKENIDIVVCSYYTEKDGVVEKVVNQKYVPNMPLSTTDFLLYIYERDKFRGVGGYLWNRLFRRQLLKDNDNLLVSFPLNFSAGEDIIFLAEANIRSKQIMYIEQPLYYYVQREVSLSHNNPQWLEDLSWVIAYERIIELYKNHDVSQKVIDIIIRMYVYRCGKLMEFAIQEKNKKKYEILKEKVCRNLDIYIKTNVTEWERVLWIVQLLLYQWKA